MELVNEFVTFEIAQLLKEVGFDLPCIAYWQVKENGETVEHFLPVNATVEEFGSLNQNAIPNINFVSRPLWQQMFRWFSENYKFTSSVYEYYDNTWRWTLSVNGHTPTADSSGETLTRELALLAFVKRAIYKIQNPTAPDETVHERSLRLLSELLESPASDRYFEDLRLKEELQELRFKKFEKYLESHDFSVLIDRLVKEHDEEYRDKCYKRGWEPFPNNKMQFLLDFVGSRGEKIELGSVDDNMFESALYLYKDYYFQLSQGQGCFWRIFNLQKEEVCTI